jgi:hypothetical protein
MTALTPSTKREAEHKARVRFVQHIEALEVALAALKADVRFGRGWLDFETQEMKEALLAAYSVFEIDALHEAAEAIPDEEPEPCDPRNPYGLTASERGWVL